MVEKLKNYTLLVTYKPEATLGKFIDPDKMCPLVPIFGRPREFEGKRNLHNDPSTEINESCFIPEGNYLVEWTYSPRFKRDMFLINVPGWEGVRFHPANSIDDLDGCMAPCYRIIENVKYNGKVYRYWADYGKYTGRAKDFVKEQFEDKLPKKFTLTVTSDETLCTTKIS